MLEIVVVAILVAAVAAVAVLSAGEKETASRTWPLMTTGRDKSEPAEEGATVAAGDTAVPEPEVRKAA